eukprot:2277461-Prymnesium_polylepis.1
MHFSDHPPTAERNRRDRRRDRRRGRRRGRRQWPWPRNFVTNMWDARARKSGGSEAGGRCETA